MLSNDVTSKLQLKHDSLRKLINTMDHGVLGLRNVHLESFVKFSLSCEIKISMK